MSFVHRAGIGPGAMTGVGGGCFMGPVGFAGVVALAMAVASMHVAAKESWSFIFDGLEDVLKMS
jgi:hypothetical protein